MRRIFAVCAVGAGLVGGAACGGTTTVMGYRWPDSKEWQERVLPPRAIQVAPAGYGAPVMQAMQYQMAVCESIASAYGELARNRVDIGTVLAGSGGFLAGAGTVLVGASQVVDENSSARTPLLWTGVSAGVLGAGLCLWAAFSGATQASAYNDAVTHVRGHVDDFLSNVRSHDSVAGEPLSESILVERLCALREDCTTPEFNVREVGQPFGDSSPADAVAEKYLEGLCKAPHAAAAPAAPPAAPPPPAGP
jgi:hypothetical protein